MMPTKTTPHCTARHFISLCAHTFSQLSPNCPPSHHKPRFFLYLGATNTTKSFCCCCWRHQFCARWCATSLPSFLPSFLHFYMSAGAITNFPPTFVVPPPSFPLLFPPCFGANQLIGQFHGPSNPHSPLPSPQYFFPFSHFFFSALLHSSPSPFPFVWPFPMVPCARGGGIFAAPPFHGMMFFPKTTMAAAGYGPPLDDDGTAPLLLIFPFGQFPVEFRGKNGMGIGQSGQRKADPPSFPPFFAALKMANSLGIKYLNWGRGF